jgi:hypothetical protein
LEPGKWEVMQGIDSRGDGLVTGAAQSRQFDFEHDRPLTITFAPRATTVIELKLISKGTPYWDRPDLGIGKDDVVIQDRKVTVTVHSLGAADAPATTLALMDANGKVFATVAVQALKAPLDLMPKTAAVTLTIPLGASMKNGSVVVDPDATTREITRLNNQVKLN